MCCFIRILPCSMSEETFEVTAKEYRYYEIGNTFIKDAVLENEEGDRE